MDTKGYLNRAYILARKIETNKMQRMAAIEKATDISAHISEDKVQTSPNGKSTVEIMMSIAIDLERKISTDEAMLKEIRTEIEALIDTVNDNDIKMILKLRYLCYFTWDQIAQQSFFSTSKVFALHREGLKICSSKQSQTVQKSSEKIEKV